MNIYLKKTLIFSLLFFNKNIFSSKNSNLELIDEIACFRIGESGISTVFLSDSWFISPIGNAVELEEKIIRTAWLSYGADHGIKMINDGSSKEYAEEYFDKLNEERGISRDKLIEMCKKSGFTIDDVKRELNEQFLFQQCIETAISAEGLIYVSPEEIQKFHEENKIEIPGKYKIQRGIYKVKTEEFFNNSKNKEIEWEDEYEISENNLSEKFSNIAEVKDGEIINLFNENDKVIVYKRILFEEKKNIGLNERYEQIQRILQQKKYLDAYKKKTYQLISDESMIFTNNKYKERCLSFIEKI
jgi:hypothetical protein